MQAGALNRRITIQQRSPGQDENGAQIDAWADVCSIWASIKPLSGQELMAAQAVQSEISHRITIRYQLQFSNPKHVATLRIMYKERIFNIHAAMNIEEANKMIEILATEGVNQG